MNNSTVTNTKFKATPKSLKELFKHKNVLFTVPAYQRSYTWTVENAEQLLDDIENFSRNRKGNQVYYIGNVIMRPEEKTSSPSETEYQIVDGQQRLTTFLLIGAAIRQELKKKAATDPTVNDHIKKIEEMIYLKKDTDNSELQIKIYNKDFDETMKSIMFTGNLNKLNKDLNINKNYQLNYNAIHSKLIRDYKDSILKILDVLEYIEIVEIILSTDDDPLVIFENINSKGKELSAHDLIKNYLYILASKSEYSKREKINVKIKDIFDNKIFTKIKPKEIETFWKVFSSILGRNKQSTDDNKEIYKHFKESSTKEFALRVDDPKEMYTKLNTLIEKIEQAFDQFLIIKSFDKDIYKYEHRWERSLASMVKNDFNSLIPILLKAYIDFDDERITKQGLREFIIAINKYKLRRYLSIKKTKDLKNFSVNFLVWLNKDNTNLPVTKAYLLEYLSSPQVITSENNRNITDNDLKQNLVRFDIYSSKGDKGVAKEILVELEWSLNKNEGIMVGSEKSISIEHLMPQTIINSKGEYVKGWEHISEGDHINKLHTLGNLTLTLDNSEMGNKSFEEKCKWIYDSNLRINKEFINVTSWDIEDIDNRALRLANEVVKLWKI